MTFEQLEYFLAVEKYMSFSVAAQEICVSQSSLSKQIKALEKELEVELFKRNAHSIELTLKGQEFSHHASKIMEDYLDMRESFKIKPAIEKVSFQIASIPVLSYYGLEKMIMDYRKLHKNLRIDVFEQESSLTKKLLQKGSNALFILRDYHLPTNIDIKVFPFTKDELVLVTNSEHRLANKKQISLLEAKDDTFLLLNSSTGMHNFSLEACKNTGFIPNVHNLDCRIPTIKKMVERNEGVTLLMSKVAEYIMNPSLRMLSLSEHPGCNLCLVSTTESLNKTKMDFIEYVIDYMKN